MERFICIHGHFYQPPRENPWLETVELQDSAAPYHDWNERISAECYAPNATARILNGEGRIRQIISNYSRISFNFGPTLLAWMHDKMPDVLDAIVKADQLSREHFAGHGSAVAQVYNHMIMPLANDRDKDTQAIWGVRDFEHRFGRAPEGMWLAETAADTPSLEALARCGIKYTLLSPFQASKVREIGKRSWRDVNGGRIDPKRPYLVRLRSGKTINVFFYDAPVSQAVAFERLLTSGERFAHRLSGVFMDKYPGDQLVHIATDGESYGHHHKHGEMALAYSLNLIEEGGLGRLTNYGEYLEKHPPTHEVQIHEGSAWSCVHGVGRWMSDCGCNSGGHGHWNQQWRAPLRHALDWLRDTLAPMFEQKGLEYLKDPWAARDAYISIILDRSPESRERYFAEHARVPLDRTGKAAVLKLMELQRHAMLMYTSCGWFFDELSGIETVQVIQYAARALQLAEEAFDCNLEPGFLERLQHAKSNIPEHCDGRCIYEKFVRPAMINRTKAMAHFAISSVFKRYEKRSRVFAYSFDEQDRHFFASGKTRLLVGRSEVNSEITDSRETFMYAILYMGEHNLTGGVRSLGTTPDTALNNTASDENYDAMLADIKAAYDAADFPGTIRRIDHHFGQSPCSLTSLFKDEQRRILNEILATTREDLEARFRLISERYAPLMTFLRNAHVPLPSALETVHDFVLHSDIRGQLSSDRADLGRLGAMINEALHRGDRIFDEEIKYLAARRIGQLVQELATGPEDLDVLRYALHLAEQVIPPLQIGLNLWKVQNVYWEMLQSVAPKVKLRAESGDQAASDWLACFLALGRTLGFAAETLRSAESMQMAA
jgi:alpha-amylase/alpha-mannosidase (GH57 family)